MNSHPSMNSSLPHSNGGALNVSTLTSKNLAKLTGHNSFHLFGRRDSTSSMKSLKSYTSLQASLTKMHRYVDHIARLDGNEVKRKSSLNRSGMGSKVLVESINELESENEHSNVMLNFTDKFNEMQVKDRSFNISNINDPFTDSDQIMDDIPFTLD